MSELANKIEDVLAGLLPAAREAGELSGRSIKVELALLMKQHIDAFVKENVTTTLNDGRVKQWNMSLTYIEVHEGDQGEVVAESGEELVTGFGGIIELIRDMTEQMHEKEGYCIEDLAPFTVKTLKHKLNSLRPTLSNSGGRAKTHIPYLVGRKKFSCVIKISRDGMPLTLDT